MEFESFQSGFLLYIGLQVGESAKVDDLLAIIGPKGVSVNHLVDNFGKNNSSVDKTEEPVSELVETKLIVESPTVVVENKETVNNKRLFISPLAKKLALEKNIFG